MAFANVLGQQLVSHTGDVDIATLEGKNVLIYFSAHWCPPCRGFTPTLVDWYKKHATEHNFEIIFASSDRDQAAFDEYYGEMPWLALPFALRAQKEKLSKKFKVSGIPTLVVLGKDGQLITDNGRGKVDEDPDCKSFPWAPVPYTELISKATLVDGEGKQSGGSSVLGKVHGLYFSAHWCPPCKTFTPQLIESYKKINADGKDFEIIFVSSDRDQSSFDEYFGSMPWKALSFEDRQTKAALSDSFGVTGIPTFVVIDEHGKVISTDGRSAVSADPEGKEFPWHPKPVNDLKDGPGAINDLPSLVVVCDGCTDEIKAKATDDLNKVAKAHWAAHPEEKEFAFFTISSSEGLGQRVKELCKVEKVDTPTVVMVDVPKYFHSAMTETSEQALNEFLLKFHGDHSEKETGSFGS